MLLAFFSCQRCWRRTYSGSTCWRTCTQWSTRSYTSPSMKSSDKNLLRQSFWGRLLALKVSQCFISKRGNFSQTFSTVQVGLGWIASPSGPKMDVVFIEATQVVFTFFSGSWSNVWLWDAGHGSGVSELLDILEWRFWMIVFWIG